MPRPAPSPTRPLRTAIRPLRMEIPMSSPADPSTRIIPSRIPSRLPGKPDPIARIAPDANRAAHLRPRPVSGPSFDLDRAAEHPLASPALRRPVLRPDPRPSHQPAPRIGGKVPLEDQVAVATVPFETEQPAPTDGRIPPGPRPGDLVRRGPQRLGAKVVALGLAPAHRCLSIRVSGIGHWSSSSSIRIVEEVATGNRANHRLAGKAGRPPREARPYGLMPRRSGSIAGIPCRAVSFSVALQLLLNRALPPWPPTTYHRRTAPPRPARPRPADLRRGVRQRLLRRPLDIRTGRLKAGHVAEGTGHVDQSEPWRDRLGAYRLTHPEIVRAVVSQAWAESTPRTLELPISASTSGAP